MSFAKMLNKQETPLKRDFKTEQKLANIEISSFLTTQQKRKSLFMILPPC